MSTCRRYSIHASRRAFCRCHAEPAGSDCKEACEQPCETVRCKAGHCLASHAAGITHFGNVGIFICVEQCILHQSLANCDDPGQAWLKCTTPAHRSLTLPECSRMPIHESRGFVWFPYTVVCLYARQPGVPFLRTLPGYWNKREATSSMALA
jgi:hypothetical protein